MSTEQQQQIQHRIQKCSPSLVNKQGPLKATIPMSSVLKQNTCLKTQTSPTLSPNASWKVSMSPDHVSGQRSPGSATYKGKQESSKITDCSVIRRTASLDTIYLKGRWPKENFYWHCGTLQINKATQTDESDLSDARKIRSICESEEKLGKIMVRQKIRSGKASPGDQTLDSSSQTLSSCILSPSVKAVPLNIPMKPSKASFRSSVEGLNQEIERIVLKTDSIEYYIDRGDKYSQMTPEGHRAPLAELFRTRSRSVNTQTPNIGEFSSSSGPPSRGSISPLMKRHIESPYSETGESQGSSPDQETSKLGTSPHINKFLAREPPDGCEKVLLKTLDEQKRAVQVEHVPQPCTFTLKPSLRSAFQILQPNSNVNDQFTEH